MKKYEIDQTKFATEEPLFEPIGSYPEPEYEEREVKPPLLKRRKVVVTLVAAVTVLVMLLLLIVNVIIQRSKLVTVPEPSPTIENKRVPATEPLLKRVEVAKLELKEADPTKNELVYPTLDYSIRLDPKSR